MAQLKAGTTVGGIPVVTTAGGVFTGNITAPVLVSNVAQGTAPLIVTSTTAVTNLNADRVDGYDFNQSLKTTDKPVFAGIDSTAMISINSAGPILQWYETDQATDEKKWWMVPDSKTMELRTITDAGGTGVTAFRVTRGTGTAVSKVEFPSLPVSASTFTSTVAAGTAPLTVTSTTKVTNLNADLLDGYDTSTTSTGSTVAVRNASGHLLGTALRTGWGALSSGGDGKAVVGHNVYYDTTANAYKYQNTHANLGSRGIVYQWDSSTHGTPYWFDMGLVATTADATFTPTLYKIWHENSYASFVDSINVNTGSSTIGIGYNIDGNMVLGTHDNDGFLYINAYDDGGVKAANYMATMAYGDFESTGTLRGLQLQSSVATGTAPLIVASTTRVDNLNVQYVNGYAAAVASTALCAAVRDSTKKLSEVSAVRANVSDLQITATTQTTVATYTTTSKANYTAKVYLRLSTPATVTVYVKYTDATGAQTITVLNAEYLPTDSYTFPPYFFNATSGSTVSILVTSTVANVVYVSAAIIEE